jgi:hypothetical protein
VFGGPFGRSRAPARGAERARARPWRLPPRPTPAPLPRPQCLGTFITEFRLGERRCARLFGSREAAQVAADQLADIAEHYGFDVSGGGSRGPLDSGRDRWTVAGAAGQWQGPLDSGRGNRGPASPTRKPAAAEVRPMCSRHARVQKTDEQLNAMMRTSAPAFISPGLAHQH